MVHPNVTLYVRVQRVSLLMWTLIRVVLLAADRSLTALHRDIVIACIHGEMTVKTLELRPNCITSTEE